MLDDRDGMLRWRVIVELVHEPPGRVGVKEIEIGKRRAAMLDNTVPPWRRTEFAVPRADLMWVLSVACDAGSLQSEMDGFRNRGVAARERLANLTSLVEPTNDLCIVGGGVGKGGSSQGVTCRVGQRSLFSEFTEHRLILFGARKDCDVLMILRGASNHRGSPDIDELDRRI